MLYVTFVQAGVVMKEREWEFAKQLKHEELIATLRRCVKEDPEVTARLLVHLGEVDARGLFRDLGFSSMFDYAVQALHMSESEAALRIRAARLGREFPSALAMVARGELHMTALRLLAPVLTASNLELLEQARFKSKLEIQKLIAAHFPQPDVASVIRKLPALRAASTSSGPATPVPASASDAEAHSVELASNVTHPGPAAKGSNFEQSWLRMTESAAPQRSENSMPSIAAPADCGALPAVPDSVRADAAVSGGASVRAPAASACVPLSQGRYKVQFTATQSLVDLFDEARDLLQHQTQKPDLASIVERALTLWVAERKKQRFAQTSKPRGQRLSKSDAAADEAGPTTVRVRDELDASTRIIRGESGASTRIDHNEPEVSAAIVHGESQVSTRIIRGESEASTRIIRGESEASKRVVRGEPEVSKPNTRHIPHAVRRQVYARDAGRCCFVSSEGSRCQARGRLEFHHIVPFARGGEATLDNICLMCRAHNALVAEQDYGRELVKGRMIGRRAAPHDAGVSRHEESAEQRTRACAFASAPPVSSPTMGLVPDPA
jgi:hypothetical protein